MPATFESFAVLVENEAGVPTPVGAGVSVRVWSSTLEADVAESPLTTDSNGEITAVSLTVTAGDRLHFRVEDYEGLAGSVTQIAI